MYTTNLIQTAAIGISADRTYDIFATTETDEEVEANASYLEQLSQITRTALADITAMPATTTDELLAKAELILQLITHDGDCHAEAAQSWLKDLTIARKN